VSSKSPCRSVDFVPPPTRVAFTHAPPLWSTVVVHQARSPPAWRRGMVNTASCLTAAVAFRGNTFWKRDWTLQFAHCHGPILSRRISARQCFGWQQCSGGLEAEGNMNARAIVRRWRAAAVCGRRSRRWGAASLGRLGSGRPRDHAAVPSRRREHHLSRRHTKLAVAPRQPQWATPLSTVTRAVRNHRYR